MEVRCVVCGNMFSVDDNEYKGEWENFCSLECQAEWFDQKKEGITPYSAPEPFTWLIQKENSDGDG